MKKLLAWTLCTLALAVVVHLLTVWLMPSVVISKASEILTEPCGTERNTFCHHRQATPGDDPVVMSCPDMLYSFAAFDLSGGPLRITAPVAGDYWSLAMYADNTDNFYVINSAQASGGKVDLVLVGPDSQYAAKDGETLVRAPSTCGMLMMRILVTDPARLEELVRLQHGANCIRIGS